MNIYINGVPSKSAVRWCQPKKKLSQPLRIILHAGDGSSQKKKQNMKRKHWRPWGVPEIVVTPKSIQIIHFIGIFPYKPSIWGYLHLQKPPSETPLIDEQQRLLSPSQNRFGELGGEVQSCLGKDQPSFTGIASLTQNMSWNTYQYSSASMSMNTSVSWIQSSSQNSSISSYVN